MLKRLRDFFKSKQKGQSMIFVAALAPFAALFVGTALDFGWLYLNQSRLQSAADAAATAGANTLVGNDTMPETPLSDYHYTSLVANTDSGLNAMKTSNIISTRSKDGTSTNGRPAGDSVAKVYAQYHLQNWLGSEKTKLVTSDDVGNKYDGNSNLVSENIKFNSVLYGTNSDDYEALYYTVTLSTKLEHLFGGILETFGVGKLPAVATSAVKITHVAERSNVQSDSDFPHGPSLYIQMKEIESSKTYPFWESISKQTSKSGSTLNANDRAIITAGASYQLGNLYRTETMDLNNYGVNSGAVDSYVRSQHNYSNLQVDWDNLFIDFEPDVGVNLGGSDYDLYQVASSGHKLADTLGVANDAKRYYRIHYPIMINSIYGVRATKQPPDSLYISIEQEVGIKYVTYSDGSQGSRSSNSNTVHQIIISNNIANTNAATDRPLVFFYEGPEVMSKSEASSSGLSIYDGDDYVGIRPFLPVIFNLYADFRGILFIPNNPVIINGNGYNFEGFVVAREFRRLKTSDDFETEKSSSGKQKYVHFNYPQYQNNKWDNTTLNAYAEINTLKDVSSLPSSFYASSYNYSTSNQKYVKIQAYINGTWKDAYLQDKQYYSNPSVKTDKIQINYNGDTNKYAYPTMILFPIEYNGKKYVATPDSKFYVKVDSEQVTDYNSSVQGSFTNLNIAEMYISGTSYEYEETYYNVNGETKTKTTRMCVGDVAWMPVTTVDATTDSDGNYTETPGDASSFQSDDALRYDYMSIFNLDESSTYNSFLNVGLVNYTYLSKNEASSTSSSAKSHDMFFTTARSKHVD